ncbi:MAG: xanthine dehydrogenase family protein molybdopterin-binding subunit [Anaerolineaceae bacterium]|nr:xanthine dehydrogenase family protein molybdopterin-binding subunit [Anaerolineaceae bacterium]
MAYQIIGKSIQQLDTKEKVTGQTLYSDDLAYENMVWLSTVFARRAHARILNIDVAEAQAVPGVLGILTAKDVPVNEYGQQKNDQAVLCGPGSPSGKEGADVVRFIGDHVALVIAENQEIAEKARALIKIDYEDLPLVEDPEFAMSGKAYQLHTDTPNNIFEQVHIRKGDVEAAWAECDVIVEGTYKTPFQEHAFLQTEAGVAFIDEEERITVHAAGQWAWDDRHEIAHALDLPEEKVRVVYDAIGGAFGGKEDVSVQIILALAVYWLDKRGIRRPVKTIWSREESTIGHCKRHPIIIRAKWGAKADGRLVAAEVNLIADGGAYMSTSNKVLKNASITVTGPYEFPHAKVDSYAVYTNNLFSGAFRGFGAPQGAQVAEMQMNKLAVKLGMDAVEIRLKNVLDEKKLLTVGTTIPGGVSLDKVILKTASAGNWEPGVAPRPKQASKELPHIVSGQGFAVGFKNVGFSYDFHDNAWALVELYGTSEIKKAIVRIDGSDLGQGHHTVMAQIAAEALGVGLDIIELKVADTAQVNHTAGCAAASRLTFMSGNAVIDAAKEALNKWRNEERPATAEVKWVAPKTTTFDEKTGYCMPNFAYGYVAQMVNLTVNTETGQVEVARVVCADDVGKAINPELIKGQIEGGIVQAHGYVLMEDFRLEQGQVLTPDLTTYRIPGIYDVPDRIDTILVEEPHPLGPYGVRGVGEMPLLPYAPAVIAAVYDATGIWFDEFPLTPERVLRGLGKLD